MFRRKGGPRARPVSRVGTILDPAWLGVVGPCCLLDEQPDGDPLLESVLDQLAANAPGALDALHLLEQVRIAAEGAGRN